MYICDFLCGYLWRSDVPALIKELLFHLLAQTLRKLRQSEGNISDVMPSATPTYSPTMPLLKALQTELQTLYMHESKTMKSATIVSGHGMGLGVGDNGRFSSYFQALLEVGLAIAEVTPLHPVRVATQTSFGETDVDASSDVATGQPSTSPGKTTSITFE